MSNCSILHGHVLVMRHVIVLKQVEIDDQLVLVNRENCTNVYGIMAPTEFVGKI